MQKIETKECEYSEDKSSEKMYKKMSVFLLIIVLALLAVLIKAYLDGEFRSVDTLRVYIARYGMFGPIVLTVIQAMQVVLPILPGFLGCVVGAVLYGPLVGFLCNYIGISAGSIAAFYIARIYGEPLVRGIFSKAMYDKWATRAAKSKSYTAFLFLAMLLPLFPDDFLCYFTGLTKMTGRKFIQIIITGKPWCILAYSLIFSMIK